MEQLYCTECAHPLKEMITGEEHTNKGVAFYTLLHCENCLRDEIIYHDKNGENPYNRGQYFFG